MNMPARSLVRIVAWNRLSCRITKEISIVIQVLAHRFGNARNGRGFEIIRNSFSNPRKIHGTVRQIVQQIGKFPPMSHAVRGCAMRSP